MRRKPGTDTEFPAQFAGNWLSVPGFARGICCPFVVPPKRSSTQTFRFAPKTEKERPSPAAPCSRHSCKPGTDTNFRRSLPEFGCLSQGLPLEPVHCRTQRGSEALWFLLHPLLLRRAVEHQGS